MLGEFYKTTIAPWSPVIVRGSLWVIIAVLTDLRHDFHDMAVNPAKFQSMTWAGWVDIFTGAFLSGAIALRLFLDGSVARHEERLHTGDTQRWTKA